MRTTEANRALVLRFYEEVWNRGNVDVAHEVFAADYVRHDLRPSAALPGPDGQAKIAAKFRAAFPDLRMTVDLIVAEDDLVSARWTTSERAQGGDRRRPLRRSRGSRGSRVRPRDPLRGRVKGRSPSDLVTLSSSMNPQVDGKVCRSEPC
jgi:predicted SnoaL-like aldol condensation-catalyzing enzyme